MKLVHITFFRGINLTF